MRITENFKNKLKIAKDMGYENVYVIVGGYKFTTYIAIHRIEALEKLELGKMIRHATCIGNGGWTGFPNERQIVKGRDIKYSDIFRL